MEYSLAGIPWRMNVIVTAFHNIRNGKAFSIINIFGLAMGLAVCLLIALFVAEEFSYDRYNDNAERIFRITSDIHPIP
jgi:putative ABC transport system permease protein